jgi:hypothetical protein|tara:strand:- start:241 stop:375 length:135 start_codon:yes stop_codon:yes gene_type:complete
MAKKTIKIEVSNASKMQIQTFIIELGIIARTWLRKVGVRIKVVK